MVGPPVVVARARTAVATALADLADGDHVLVACSGGQDSLALAATTSVVAQRSSWTAGAVVVDHGLQPGSDRTADRAAAVSADLGLSGPGVVAVRVDDQGGPEAAARTARYAALRSAAREVGAAAVLLGHTLDDQAETVLLGLARGSGARSLAGMPARRGLYRRPLLTLTREQTGRVCRDLGLQPWLDPHNEDPRHTRVRVRRDALPALEQALGAGTPEALARSADLLRDDADALDGWAERVVSDVLAAGGVPPTPTVQTPVDVVAGLPAAVRRRVLLALARRAGSPGGALSAGHARALDALVAQWHGQGPVALPGGVAASRACGKLTFSGPGADPGRPGDRT